MHVENGLRTEITPKCHFKVIHNVKGKNVNALRVENGLRAEIAPKYHIKSLNVTHVTNL